MTMNPQVLSNYHLGPVKPWVADAANYVGSLFKVKTIYGWRASDPFPDHPSGHALDFMITSKVQGQDIADFFQKNAASFNVKYIIWNRQVWEANGKPVAGWHAYTSTTNPHTDHVHVTFNDAPGTGIPSALPASTGASSSGPSTNPDCAWGAHVPVYGDICVATKVQVRAIAGVLLLGTGVVVGLVGVALLIADGFKGGVATAASTFVPGVIRRG
jgi:hypothetical protein